MEEAEAMVLYFLKDVCGLQKFTCPIGGNSVGEDKAFIRKDMPRLYDFLHYRVIDVSTISGVLRRWKPEFPYFKK
jgi:oligoribonuclease